jgi:predicted nucleic acid-binding protein
MQAVFADTAYYLALLNQNDEYHAAAVARSREITSVVTTAWVLTELADAMCRPRHRGLVSEFIRDLRNDSRVTIVELSTDLFDRGLELFESRADKNWSLTDCISFLVMQQRGLSESLSADHHFVQAGFTILLP